MMQIFQSAATLPQLAPFVQDAVLCHWIESTVGKVALSWKNKAVYEIRRHVRLNFFNCPFWDTQL